MGPNTKHPVSINEQPQLPADLGDLGDLGNFGNFGDFGDVLDAEPWPLVRSADQPALTSHFMIAKVARLTPRVDVRKPADLGAITKPLKTSRSRAQQLAQALAHTLQCDEPPLSLTDNFDATPDNSTKAITTTLSVITASIDDDFYSFSIGQVLKAGPRVAWLQCLMRCS